MTSTERSRVAQRILVGYTATPAGEDALAAGAALAASFGADLDVVLAMPDTSRCR